MPWVHMKAILQEEDAFLEVRALPILEKTRFLVVFLDATSLKMDEGLGESVSLWCTEQLWQSVADENLGSSGEGIDTAKRDFVLYPLLFSAEKIWSLQIRLPGSG